MLPKRSFGEQSLRFRAQVLVAYKSVLTVVRDAYHPDSESQREYIFGNKIGLLEISNMLAVYIWALLEAYMRKAYIAIHDGNPPKDFDVRRNNRGWSQMREWLTDKNMFNENLGKFDELFGEFCARRNCIVHNNGIVDDQYVNQVRAYGVESAFSIGDTILTEWPYHKKLEDALVDKFNLHLKTEVELFPRESVL